MCFVIERPVYTVSVRKNKGKYTVVMHLLYQCFFFFFINWVMFVSIKIIMICGVCGLQKVITVIQAGWSSLHQFTDPNSL